jgi:RND superfamily putative drug exporter
MVLLGRANWWFPRFLDRLIPDFSIEGEEWFREREAAAGTPSPAPPPAVPAGAPKPP